MTVQHPARSVPLSFIRDFVDRLGFDLSDVARIVVMPGRIEVTQFRHNTEGDRFVAGDRAAQITVDIAIEEPDAGA